MPPIRTHEEVDDDDGMPPLVDNPMDNPNFHPSMSFTFFTDMTPITAHSAEPTIYEMAPETSILASPPDSPNFYEGPMPAPADARTSHGKKRDASYIPRPPNAFILFRSSFIRSQQVPGKVEGNHSTLSKIIGMYWKTLPREERKVWEAKALVAQAEHRKRYPDWRFRPGSNALAKLKVKDGGTGRKRNSQSNRKGKGDGEVKEKSDEKRCAKIADFLVEGKKGVDLEVALREWEGNSIKGEVKEGTKADTKADNESEHGRVTMDVSHKQDITKTRLGQGEVMTADQDGEVTHNVADDIATTDKADTANTVKSRCLTPDASPDLRFKVPLTAMFKRSLSAPASQTRSPAHNTFSPSVQATRRGSFVSPMPHMLSFPYEASLSPLLPIKQHEAIPRAVSDDTASEKSFDCLSPLTMSPTFERGTLAHWSDPFDLPMGSPAGPDTPDICYDQMSPTPSPVMDVFTSFNFASPAPTNNTNIVQGGHVATTVKDGEMYHHAYGGYNSSFSTLKDWAGDMTYKRTSPRVLGELSFVPSIVNDSDIVDTAISDYGWSQAMYNESYCSTEMQHLQHYPSSLDAFTMNSAIGLV